MNQEQSKKYIEIIKTCNMDDMYDFGFLAGQEDMWEKVMAVLPNDRFTFPRGEREKGHANGFNDCLSLIRTSLLALKPNQIKQ